MPVFAYYYLWMTGWYWSEHKLDHPVEPFPGNYRSDNPAVIGWQVRQARAAGLTGFIVSWKDTPAYRRILPLVERGARKGGLKLALEYEGLNAARQPLPVAKVAADFRFFTSTYASNPVWYRIDGKPRRRVQAARCLHRRGRLLLVLGLPGTGPLLRQQARGHGCGGSPGSQDLDRAVRARRQRHPHRRRPGRPPPRWRHLRVEYATAARSAPDILGLISWNEWTENTYVEPSVKFGFTYLKKLRTLIRPGTSHDRGWLYAPHA